MADNEFQKVDMSLDPNITDTSDNDGVSTQQINESVEHYHHHHHHSHHGHHHHYHSHHSKKSNKKRNENRILLFIKHNKKKLINISLVCAFALILVVVALIIDRQTFDQTVVNSTPSGTTTESEAVATGIVLEAPVINNDVTIVSSGVVDYLNGGGSGNVVEIYNKYKDGGRIDTGLPVRLSYNIKGASADCHAESSKFEISEHTDFTNPRVFVENSTKNYYDVWHLKTGTQYYYRITVTLSNDQFTSVSGSFKTADTPRILSIDGLVNVRDIGGWDTITGKKIKQGLLYRGSEMDGVVEQNFSITTKGVNDMLTVLEIRTDMDLRASTDNNGVLPLGANVKRIYYGVTDYSNVFSVSAKENIRKVFSDLADKSNYPVYLHCTYGKDRTGTVCYLLGALLGMSEKDLMKDYELSALYYGTNRADDINGFVTNLKTYKGELLRDKAENYLLSIGVTEQEIKNIRDIFLGD